MLIKSLPEIKKKIMGSHGDTALYQTFWQGDEKPDDIKSFRNFARITVKPGGTNKVHTHNDVEQIYIILQGKGTVEVGEEKAQVKAGDAIYLPAKIPHGFFNTSDKTTILLLIGTQINN